MKDSSSRLTPKEAAQLAGYTPRHMLNLIVRGKVSAIKEDGRYFIERSEFFRVFPDAHKKEMDRTSSTNEVEVARMEAENALLKEMANQRQEELDFLRDQITVFNKEKHQMLDAITSQTRILEHTKAITTIESEKKTGFVILLRNKQ